MSSAAVSNELHKATSSGLMGTEACKRSYTSLKAGNRVNVYCATRQLGAAFNG